MTDHQTPSEFVQGERVQLHPATDLWMRGARYGEVVRTTKTRVHVRVDAINRIVRFPADLVVHCETVRLI